MTDAANCMFERGWKFQQAYSSIYFGNSIIYWIFLKDSENIEETKKVLCPKLNIGK